MYSFSYGHLCFISYLCVSHVGKVYRWFAYCNYLLVSLFIATLFHLYLFANLSRMHNLTSLGISYYLARNVRCLRFLIQLSIQEQMKLVQNIFFLAFHTQNCTTYCKGFYIFSLNVYFVSLMVYTPTCSLWKMKFIMELLFHDELTVFV